MNRMNVYTTRMTAIIVSINTIGFKIGIGCCMLARQAIVCFVAIALITNGNVFDFGITDCT